MTPCGKTHMQKIKCKLLEVFRNRTYGNLDYKQVTEMC